MERGRRTHAARTTDRRLTSDIIVNVPWPDAYDVIVFGNVDRYAISGDLVIGAVTKPKPPAEEPDYYDDVRVGFFLLDTKTGMLASGLDESSWHQLLQKLGVRQIPELKSTCSEN